MKGIVDQAGRAILEIRVRSDSYQQLQTIAVWIGSQVAIYSSEDARLLKRIEDLDVSGINAITKLCAGGMNEPSLSAGTYRLSRHSYG